MTDAPINLRARYEWEAEVEVPLPTPVISVREKIAGLRAELDEIIDDDGYSVASGLSVVWHPWIDDHLDAALHDVIETHGPAFAAKAKQKGFERASTGLSAHVVALTDTHARVRLTMTRAKP